MQQGQASGTRQVIIRCNSAFYVLLTGVEAEERKHDARNWMHPHQGCSSGEDSYTIISNNHIAFATA
jgi:hypothetical protein